MSDSSTSYKVGDYVKIRYGTKSLNKIKGTTLKRREPYTLLGEITGIDENHNEVQYHIKILNNNLADNKTFFVGLASTSPRTVTIDKTDIIKIINSHKSSKSKSKGGKKNKKSKSKTFKKKRST